MTSILHNLIESIITIMAPSVGPSTTVLRIKRPRTVDPLPTLQFAKRKRARQETVDDLAEDLATSNLSSSPFSTNTLTWKRIETSLSEAATEKESRKRSLKYVDATLNRIDPKRQKLALTLEKSPTSKNSLSPRPRAKNAILDPTYRLIDQKMKQIQEGSSTLQQYLDFLEHDERVMHDTNRFLSWTLPDGSNVLHLAALWNNVEEARYILMSYPKALCIDSANVNGQRPYQNAILAGNDQVAQLLVSFGADTHDYVYDVFQLVTEQEQEEQIDPTYVELRGGVGYLNEHGELILETLCPEDYGHDSDDDFAQEDDDVDSNAEDHEHNDYPDEESDEDYASDDAIGFRHDRVPMPVGRMAVNSSSYPDEDRDAEYDAQYGLYDGNDEGNTQHFYAYDPDLDDDH